jgi:hypothetical protein
MSEGKTITINTDDNTVSVEQTAPDTGLNVGGVSLNTDLPWYGDAVILLILIALIYIGKKWIDAWKWIGKNE